MVRSALRAAMPAEVNGPEIVRAGNVEVRLTPVRNREKDYVHLAWYFAGERRQKMLRCADRNDEKRIREMAREIASAVWTARPDKIPELSINVRIMNAAREALNGFDVEIDAACREYSAARTVIGDHGSLLDAAEFYRRSKPVALKPVTIERAVDEFIASQLSESLSYQYRKEICRGLRLFARDMAGANIAEITTSQLQSWLRNLKRQDGQPLNARSRNNFRDQIVTMFRWAQSEGGYLRRDVTTEAEWTKKVKTHTDIHIFTVEQFRTLIYGAVEHDPRCIHYLAIGTFGFVRPKEIERMSPASVRFHHNDIEVREDEAKRTRRQSNRRLVPMQPALRAWLEAFPLPVSGRLVRYKTREWVRALAKKVGVPWHHDIMRHTGISYAVALTANVDQVALWAGNSRQIIYGSYLNQVTPAEAAEFYGMMPPQEEKIIRLGAQ
jgi:hypothetical protein